MIVCSPTGLSGLVFGPEVAGVLALVFVGVFPVVLLKYFYINNMILFNAFTHLCGILLKLENWD